VEFPIAVVNHLQYHRWATEQVLAETVELGSEQLLQNLKGSFPSIYDTLKHLYQSDRIWLDRLEQRPAGTSADYEVPGCMWELRDEWLPLQDRIIEIARPLNAEDLSRTISYKNLAGQPFSDPLWEVLLHIVNHGTHHRGQVTTMLRQLGLKPTNLDLIRYFRQLKH
jgi:uncharacterized damage-inducible protein DinB